MNRTLNSREKRLLLLCIGVLFLVANVLVFHQFNKRHTDIQRSLNALRKEADDNKVWLGDAAFWEKRKDWMDRTMPYTESAGKSQGLLLENLQQTALDAGLKVNSQTLLEPTHNDHFNEVAVNLRIIGDQDKVMRWLLTLQAPQLFHAMKAFELELDPRAREKVPQAQCNLTLASWFNTEPPPEGAHPAVSPPARNIPLIPPSTPPATTPETTPESSPPAEIVNPLEISSPI